MRRAVSEFPNDNPELHDGLVWSAPEPCARALPTLRLRTVPGPAPRVIGPSWLAEEPPPQLPDPVTEPAFEVFPPIIEVWDSLAAVAHGVDIEDAPSIEAAVEEATIEEVAVEEAAVEEAAVEEAAIEALIPGEAELEPERRAKSPFEQFVESLSRVALERGATRAAAVLPTLFGLERASLETLDSTVLESLRARGIVQRGGTHPTAEFAALCGAWRDVLEGTAGDLARCGTTTLDVWAAGVLGALLNAPRERTDDLRRELRKRGIAAFGLLAAA
ncbi:MAG TPA: hypothetical protein VGK73_19605 [Polyangiaceae bacterium]